MKKAWQGIHRALKPDKVGMATHVDVQDPDNTMIWRNIKQGVESANEEEITARFNRASSAPPRGTIQAFGI